MHLESCATGTKQKRREFGVCLTVAETELRNERALSSTQAAVKLQESGEEGQRLHPFLFSPFLIVQDI